LGQIITIFNPHCNIPNIIVMAAKKPQTPSLDAMLKEGQYP
jgi:hypothetical protein